MTSHPRQEAHAPNPKPASHAGSTSLNSPKVCAIIVAAGSGKRFGPGADKLFLEVCRKPIIAHTWNRFDRAPEIDEVILVIRPGLEQVFGDLAGTLGLRKPWRLTAGGRERQDSVWNGLLATPDGCELVAIQDGARPCTPPELIASTIAVARDMGAAVAAQRVTDTIKESGDGRVIDRNIDRSRLWAVQTPQTFHRSVIHRALTEVRGRGVPVTDDTAACELIGQPVRLVESRAPNPKVTYPSDLPGIEFLLQRERS